MNSYRLNKSERLKNKNRIAKIFEVGHSVFSYPIKCVFIIEAYSETFPQLEFAFTVPRKNFKKAVDRNYIKRRIKESFRLQKKRIYSSLEGDLRISGFIIFVGKEKSDFHTIDKALRKAFSKLIKKIESHE